MVPVQLGSCRGIFRISKHDSFVYLDALERTVYFFLLAHPEGISVKALPRYREALIAIYALESVYTDESFRERKIDELCRSQKSSAFYRVVAQIRRKITGAVGPREALKYIIRQDRSDSLYVICRDARVVPRWATDPNHLYYS